MQLQNQHRMGTGGRCICPKGGELSAKPGSPASKNAARSAGQRGCAKAHTIISYSRKENNVGKNCE